MSKRNLCQDFSDKKFQYYRENYVEQNRENYLRRLRNELIKSNISSEMANGSVLDVGCGPAILYPEVLQHCQSYCAFDLVESNLDEVRARYSSQKLQAVLGDLDEFVWGEEKFDLIICSGAIEYTEKPKENLQKLLHALGDGGTLLCSFPNVRSPYRLWSEHVYKYIWYLKKRVGGRRVGRYQRSLFSQRQLHDLIQTDPSVQRIECRHFGLKLLPQPLDRIFSELDYKIVLQIEKRPASWCSQFCQEFIIMIQKK